MKIKIELVMRTFFKLITEIKTEYTLIHEYLAS